jgi:hypothetical protein
VTSVEHERAQPSTGAGFADSVTFSFGDRERGLYGLARIGVGDGRGSALAVVFRDREPLAALADGDLDVTGDDWATRSAGPLATAVEAPLERWSIAWDGRFDLDFTAVSAPAEIASGGMAGYVQLCSVAGTVDGTAVACVGERRHEWGVAQWKDLELVRTVSVWLGDEEGGVALSTVRPAGARGHDEEHVAAALVERGDAVAVDDPRLSTTYDGDGHQRRAGLELWIGEEDPYPRRLAGEVICGSSMDLGQLRLDLAFMRWHGDGAEGVGRYDVLRRV